MTVDEVIAMIALKCGNRSDQNTNILNALKLVQQYELEEGDFIPWFLFKHSASLATVADTETISLPSDFIRVPLEEEGGLWITNDDGRREVKKDDLAVVRRRYQGYTNQLPSKYAIAGDKMYFGPYPDAVYALDLSYYGHDTLPAAGSTNLWTQNAPDLLIAHAGVHVAQGLGEEKAMKVFEGQRLTAMNRVVTADEMRRQGGQDA